MGRSSAPVGGKLDVMTGTDGGADPGTRPGWRWDVALSFAGAQRGYVEQVAEELWAQGVRCFYDADEQLELWGKPRAEELPAIYGGCYRVVSAQVSGFRHHPCRARGEAGPPDVTRT